MRSYVLGELAEQLSDLAVIDLLDRPAREFRKLFATYFLRDCFLVVEGEVFTGRLPPKTLLTRISQTIAKLSHLTKFEYCQLASFNLALLDSRFLYCEGLLSRPNAESVLHSWNILDDVIIDLTAQSEVERRGHRTVPIVGKPPKGWEFFGVPLPAAKLGKDFGVMTKPREKSYIARIVESLPDEKVKALVIEAARSIDLDIT